MHVSTVACHPLSPKRGEGTTCDRRNMHLSVHPIWPWPWVAVAGAVVVGLVIWVYGSTLAEQSKRSQRLLFGLRLAALVMALTAALRPSLVFTETRRQSASLGMLY